MLAFAALAFVAAVAGVVATAAAAVATAVTVPADVASRHPPLLSSAWPTELPSPSTPLGLQ